MTTTTMKAAKLSRGPTPPAVTTTTSPTATPTSTGQRVLLLPQQQQKAASNVQSAAAPVNQQRMQPIARAVKGVEEAHKNSGRARVNTSETVEQHATPTADVEAGAGAQTQAEEATGEDEEVHDFEWAERQLYQLDQCLCKAVGTPRERPIVVKLEARLGQILKRGQAVTCCPANSYQVLG
jgi:hypothetical protein